MFRSEAEQHRRVLEVATVISARVGGDFFQSLVEHLSNAVAADFGYVGELISGPRRRLKTIAVYRDDALVDNFEQDLSGTASSQILEDGALSLSADAARVFPLDPLLTSVDAQGVVGVRLCDSTAQVIGLIAFVSTKPLHDLPVISSALQTFAARAAAELERKRAFDKLRESEQRYRAFVSSNVDAMWRIELETPVPVHLPEEAQLERIRRDAYVAECNDAMARLAGATNGEDLVGTSFAELFSGTDDRLSGELREFVRSGYRGATVQTMLVDAEGKRSYRTRTQFGIVECGRLVRIWGTTRDVTELKRAQLAAEASEQRFRQILEKVHVPAVLLDRNGEITFCNDMLARLAGSSTPELTGTKWLDVIGSASEREAWSALLSADPDSDAAQRLDGTIKSHNGVSRLIVWDAFLLRDEDVNPVGVAAIGSDKGLAEPG